MLNFSGSVAHCTSIDDCSFVVFNKGKLNEGEAKNEINVRFRIRYVKPNIVAVPAHIKFHSSDSQDYVS